MKTILQRLNEGTAEDRLEQLRQIMQEQPCPEPLPQYSNNHIHTFYSFSPYSPTAAVYYAKMAGLPTAGIMDHDTLAGAEEFIKAGEIAGIATTVGIECRVSLEGTPMEGRRVNNPDQSSAAYMSLHGVPHNQIKAIQDFFAVYRERRNTRNRAMVEKINQIVAVADISLDFDKDVLPLSRYSEGGGVTERHLMCALVIALREKYGKSQQLIDVITGKMGIKLGEKQLAMLLDPENPHWDYDLLGIFKAELIEKVYVPATDECMHITELSELAQKTGALLCYPYLGDVGNSVTGDKKAQKFEDDFLDELFDELKNWKIDAVTYMPSRNTPAQLARLQKKCKEYGFFEISGEDINSPRQGFICSQLAQPEFAHLIKATWQLIEYENKASIQKTEKPKREF